MQRIAFFSFSSFPSDIKTNKSLWQVWRREEKSHLWQSCGQGVKMIFIAHFITDYSAAGVCVPVRQPQQSLEGRQSAGEVCSSCDWGAEGTIKTHTQTQLEPEVGFAWYCCRFRLWLCYLQFRFATFFFAHTRNCLVI